MHQLLDATFSYHHLGWLRSCSTKRFPLEKLSDEQLPAGGLNPVCALQVGLAQMLKGGVIMDVTTPEEARIAGKHLWSL